MSLGRSQTHSELLLFKPCQLKKTRWSESLDAEPSSQVFLGGLNSKQQGQWCRKENKIHKHVCEFQLTLHICG